eukprot:536330-Amphidinium_carterae.1
MTRTQATITMKQQAYAITVKKWQTRVLIAEVARCQRHVGKCEQNPTASINQSRLPRVVAAVMHDLSR